MPRARSLLLVTLLVASGLAALAPTVSAASTSVVGHLGVGDASGSMGLVGHSPVHYNGATYIFGGRLADNTYSDKVYRYDHATGKTTEVATIPAVLPSNSGGRYSGTAMLLGDRIYYMGGAVLVMIDINGDGKPDPVPQSSPDVFVFNPATNEIAQFSESLPKSAWGLSSAAVSASRGYVFGGFTFSIDTGKGVDASRRDWVVEFDLSRTGPTERKFRELIGVRLPHALQDAAAARIGDTIWLLGGLADHDNATNPCPPQTVYGEEEAAPVCRSRNAIPFEISTGLVRTDRMKQLPYRMQFVGAAVVDGRAYVPGGLLADDTPAASILEFDPRKAEPARVLTPTLPRGVYGSGAVTDGKSVFLFGGRHGGHTQLNGDVVRVDIAPTVPWAPRSATAAPVAGGLRIAWEPPAYDGDSPVSLYRVYRADPEGGERLLQETAKLAYDDLSVKPGAAYVYRVTALNAVGESNASARVAVNSGTTPPGAVLDFEAYAGDREVLLRWRAPESLGGANLSGYRVLRDGSVVATLPPAATEHRDTGLENGVTYAYTVRAYNVKGDGPDSPVRHVSPAAVPPSPGALAALVQEGAVSLTWEAPEGAWETFVVYRSLAPGVRGEPVAANLTTTVFLDESVEKGRTYHYHVASVNGAGESPPSAPATVSLVRTPGAPAGVKALGLEGEVRVTWQPPADAGDAPAESLRYYVTRAHGGAAGRIVATDLKGTAYVDRTAQPGVAYTYTVTTLNPLASEPSAPATATPKEIVNKPPEAVVNVLPPVARVGEAVTVDASLSSDPDGLIVAYVFDFGDGADAVQTSSSSVAHVYERNGTYTVKVIVTDDRNEDSFVTATVLVGEPRGSGSVGDDVLGGAGGAGNRTRSERPGSETPKVPGPGLLVVALGLAGAALLAGRRRRL